MISRNTVFILGAGSSIPYGYPTGQGLRELLIQSSPNAWRDAQRRAAEIEGIQFFEDDIMQNCMSTFYQSSIKSIDKFLWINKENSDFIKLGKWAITNAILNCEKTNLFNHTIADPAFQEDWYSWLYNEMISVASFSGPQDLQSNNISFITFNYDRSLEYYLYTSLKNTFSDHSQAEIAETINSFPFIHVYGQVAPLPWQAGTRTPSIAYGMHSERPQNLTPFSQSLRIMYDERQSSVIDEASELLRQAERVFFLGFGFAPENMDLLNLPSILNKKQVFATVKGLPKRIHDQTKYSFKQAISVDSSWPRFQDCGSLELLNTH